MGDLHYGRSGDRQKSPRGKSISESGREWWADTTVGDHSLTRKRTAFVCSECGDREAYPSAFEDEVCDSDE